MIRQFHPKGTLSPRGDSYSQARLGTHRQGAAFYLRDDTWEGPDGDKHKLTVSCLDSDDLSPMPEHSYVGCALCYARAYHSERLCAFMRVPAPLPRLT